MTGLERSSPALQAGCVRTLVAAEESRAPGLVVGDPVTHAITELPADRVGEYGEFVDRGTAAPASGFLQALRQVPVIERGPGLEAALEHAVDQARIEIEARGIRPVPGPVRKDTGPGDGKTIGAESQLRREVEVLRPAVVVIAGHRTARAVADVAWCTAKTIPNRLRAAVHGRRALDLIRGRRAAPAKIGGKSGSAQSLEGWCGCEVHR